MIVASPCIHVLYKLDDVCGVLETLSVRCVFRSSVGSPRQAVLLPRGCPDYTSAGRRTVLGHNRMGCSWMKLTCSSGPATVAPALRRCGASPTPREADPTAVTEGEGE